MSASAASDAPLHRVAVIGAGAAGLAAAYQASKSDGHEVTVFEATEHAGGHAWTVEVDGAPIDIGFLVYNEHTYPHLMGLFEELGVQTEPSDMSFAVSLDQRRMEWSSNSLSAVFATPGNAVSPAFYAFLKDTLRFNVEAPAFLAGGDGDTTMGAFLADHGYSDAFQQYYFLPMVAAVWSASAAEVLAFPAATLIRFMVNHSLLQLVDRPQWRTVMGRSREYVGAIVNSPRLRGRVRLASPVTSVTRGPAGVRLAFRTATPDGRVTEGEEVFDSVVFACHPDIALRLLGADASPAEAAALAGVPYADNTAYVHCDEGLMPARKETWASWNYMGRGKAEGAAFEPCCVTYWLNKLQNLGQYGTTAVPPSAPPGTRTHPGASAVGDAATANPLGAEEHAFLPAGATRVLPLAPGQGPVGAGDTGSVASLGAASASSTAHATLAARGGRPEGTPWIDRDVFVTLNPEHPPAPGTVLGRVSYAHPQYTAGTLAAQAAVAALQGQRCTWFAGAFLGYGFHEDAITSGLRVATALTGVVPGWWEAGRQARRAATVEAYAALEKDVRPLPPSALPQPASEGDSGAAAGPVKAATALGHGSSIPIAPRGSVSTVRVSLPGVSDTLFAAAAAEVAAAGKPTPPPAPLAEQAPPSWAAGAWAALAAGLGCGARGAAAPPARAIDGIAGAASKATTAGGRGSGSGVVALPSLARPAVVAGDLPALKGAAALEGGYVDMILGPRGADYAPLCPPHGRVDPWHPQAAELAERLLGGDTRPRDTVGRLHAEAFPPAAPEDIPGKLAFSLREGREGDLAFQAASKGLAVVPGDRPITQYVPRALAADMRAAVRATQGVAAPPLPAAAPVPQGPAAAAAGGYTHMYTGEGGVAAESDAPARMAGPWALVSTLGTPAWFAALGAAAGWVAGAVTDAAAGLLASPVLSALRAGVKRGCLILRLPSGQELLFGDPASPPALRAHMAVGSWAFFARVAAEADLGLARSYIAGQWTVDDLGRLFAVILANRELSTGALNGGEDWTGAAPAGGAGQRERGGVRVADVWTAWLGASVNALSFRAFLDNSIAGSRANISAHYDLSNELFETFLDTATMAYSCGIWEPSRDPRGKLVLGGTLREAQERKLDLIIKRARIRPGHRVVDVGCGWGGLAIRIALTVPDTTVHGISLSKEQLAWGQRRVEALGLGDRVTLEHVDYRTFAQAHAGEFDALVSVEMIEAVGLNYLGEYFAAVDRLLAPQGVACIQAITIPESRFDEYKGSTDFVNTVIFPGGALASLAAITEAMYRRTQLTVQGVENFNLHYARTLAEWHRNFNAVLPRVRALGFDDAFIRMWNYYLKYCEAGFAQQSLGLLVLVFTRPANAALA